jgi:hypothetical protein
VKGLYLDLPGVRARIEDLERVLGTASHLREAEAGGRRIVVSYHPAAWPQGPVHEDPGRNLVAAASGWFLYRERLGDLAGLAGALAAAADLEADLDGVKAVLKDIQGGAYVLWLSHQGREFLITDPFGLHPHYGPRGEPLARVAPSPYFLADGLIPDPQLAGALEGQNHLFGDLTAFREIVRLHPGCVLSRKSAEPYFDYRPLPSDPRDIFPAVRRVLAPFRDLPTVLPLSGGLDSRLLLAATEPAYGYTFGPADTGDRPVARRFSGRFRDYDEFSMLDLEYPLPLREAGGRIFAGTCARPFLELLPVYRRLRQRWPDASFFLDGYLGDVLQRHTYLTSGDLFGSVAKLLPFLTLNRFDPHRILRRRYAALSPEMFRRVVDAYEGTVGSLDLPATHRVLLFEIVHGRGARAALNGGTLLSGQYFTPVQPFFFPEVFRRLFAIGAREGLSYGAVRRLWSALPDAYSREKTYSGFRPTANPHLSRVTMLVTKALGKKNLYRRAVNYESEVRRIRWR